ncbi:MAG: hypothetical protein AAF629_00005 [Chloroflexota bacterium]
MTKSSNITQSFVITEDLLTRLKQWAADDDRSVSYVVRKILEREVEARESHGVKSEELHPTQ